MKINSESTPHPPGTIVFAATARFEVVSYYASHGLLLLKGDLGSKEQTHLFFKDVRAQEFRSWMNGLTITVRDIDFLGRFASKPAAVVEPGNQIYEIASEDWTGYIVGGSLWMGKFENTLMYESPLMGEAPNIWLKREFGGPELTS